MNADWRHELLEAVDRYCETTGRARSGVGTMVLNDPKFFDRIGEGKGCTVDKYQKVMQWLREQTPPRKKETAHHINGGS